MRIIGRLRRMMGKATDRQTEQPAEKGYDTWSADYDSQPGNLMLDLDEQVFSSLLKGADLENKRVMDAGCGTGRHWPLIYSKKPEILLGYDVSAGMLDQLRKKFPAALVFHASDEMLDELPAASVDCIVTTLTIAHIKNASAAIGAWSRMLTKNGEIIITDFHPELLENGGRRSFRSGNQTFFITNYIHPVKELEEIFSANGFSVLRREERFINTEVKHYYDAQQATHVYDRFKGMPVIYGLHLKRDHDTR